MKNLVTIIGGTLLCLVSSNALAQEVTGYQGRRMLTSFELELRPERNQEQEELNFELLNTWGIAPRFVLNNEYQIQTRTSLSLGIGYASPNLAIEEYSTYYEDIAVPMQQIFVQAGVKISPKLPITVSPTTYAFRLAYYSLSTDDFTRMYKPNENSPILMQNVEGANSNLLLFNVEFGKRIVFEKGFVVDFGFGLNLGVATFKFQSIEQTSTRVLTTETLQELMIDRSAMNSMLVFKIGLGQLYRLKF